MCCHVRISLCISACECAQHPTALDGQMFSRISVAGFIVVFTCQLSREIHNTICRCIYFTSNSQLNDESSPLILIW